MIDAIIVTVQLTLLGLYLWGLFRTVRRTPGPPPWPLRLVMDATGSPSMRFIYVMLGVSVIFLVIILTTTPSRAEQRQQQLDRIEQLLQELLDQHR